MKRKISIALFAVTALLSSLSATPPPPATAPAQTDNPNVPTILVADGSSTGMYANFLHEIQKVVGDTINFQEVPSSGAVENIDKLLGNKVAAAFAHSDVLFFKAQSVDQSKMGQFKTLLALFPEEVHFLALTNSGTYRYGEKNWLGQSSKQQVNFNSIEDLNGYRVGAAGGGYITAQVINNAARIPYEVVQYKSGDEAIGALNNGEVSAVVIVGGAPIGKLEGLDSSYKILPVPERVVSNLKGIYRPATVTYTNMRPEAVSTLAADCILVARDYQKSPDRVTAFRRFRQAFYSKLGELQETPGIHPKWQEVHPDERGKWAWMELGDNTTATGK